MVYDDKEMWSVRIIILDSCFHRFVLYSFSVTYRCAQWTWI